VYNQATTAYQNISKNTISGRETEARVLTEGAKRLIEVQQNWSLPNLDERLDEALRYNQRLWSLLQTELSQEDNPLPKKLRLDILRLSRFIDKRIYETMAFPSSKKLNIIIDINKNLAAGLRGSTESEY
jgi:flagellar protein FlaF